MDPSNSSPADGIQASAPVGDDQPQLQAGIVETDLPSSSGLKNEAATISNTGLHGMDRDIFVAAAKGKTEALSKHGVRLHEIFTPTKNTVLHIYVAHARYPTLTNPAELDSHSSSYDCLVADILIEKLQSAEYLWGKINTKRPIKLTASQEQRSKDTVSQLLEMCHPQLLLQPNNHRDIALHIAARYGLDGIVKVLISTIKARHHDLEKQGEEAWPMLRTTNNNGDTALHEAASFNHLDVVKILCEEDPDYPHSPNSEGKTPIYMAAERRDGRHMVSEILGSCTDPGYQGPGGKTALHAAVMSGCKEMTHKLLDKKKTLAQVRDDQGWTPLHYAALIGDRCILSQILHYDRSTAYIVDKDDNKTALHVVAASEGHVGVLIELINRCPDCCELLDRKQRNILHYAIEKRKFNIMKVVQTHPWMSNVLLNGKDVEGNTPIHQLVNIRLQTISESLIQDRKAPIEFLRDARVDKMAVNELKLNVIDILYDKGHCLSEVEKGDLLAALQCSGARPSRPIKDGARMIDNNEVGKDTVKEAIGVLMVVATLIATVTFAAGFTVPGGYRNERGPEQGLAILTKNAAFGTFVVTNTVAMMISSSTVLAYLIVRLRLAFRKISGLPYLENQAFSIFCAMLAMVIAFITGTYAVLGSSSVLAISVCVVGFCVFFGNSIWNCVGT